MWQNLKAAYTSWWGLAAMLFSSLSVFSYVSRLLKLGLTAFFHDALATYRALFHPLVAAAASLAHLTLADWQKDFVLIWLAIGGATSRTFFVEFLTSMRNVRTLPSGGTHRILEWPAFWLGILSILAWPIGWVALFWEPYFERFKTKGGGNWFYVRSRVPARAYKSPQFGEQEDVCDMRAVLAIQIATIAAVVVAFTVVNAIGLG